MKESFYVKTYPHKKPPEKVIQQSTPYDDIHDNRGKGNIPLTMKPIEAQQISINTTASETDKRKNNDQMKKTPKVMIIDDDVHLLSALSMIVESGGFEVISMSSTDEACMLLKQHTPDIILCDINLETSTMGWCTFFEKVRTTENIKHVPFILLSGLNDDALIRTGKEMGVDDFLTKPIKGEDLLAAIRGRIKRFEELKLSHNANIQGSQSPFA